MPVNELLNARSFEPSPIEAWRSCVNKHMLPGLEITPVTDGPSLLMSFDFVGARLWYASSSAQSVMRSRTSTTHRSLPVAILQLAGSSRIRQNGSECELESGTFAFVDAATPLLLEQKGRFEQLYLQFPHSSFNARSFASVVASTMTSTHVSDRLFYDCVRGLWDAAISLHPNQYGSALSALISLSNLTSVFQEAGSTPPVHIRVSRAMEYIENHLGDDDLSAVAVARRQGVSRRYLDELFAQHGYRVESWIWERRLKRAADMLSRKDSGNMTLLQIAVDLGFKSQSHFSRCFSRKFGVSPKLFRSGERASPPSLQ